MGRRSWWEAASSSRCTTPPPRCTSRRYARQWWTTSPARCRRRWPRRAGWPLKANWAVPPGSNPMSHLRSSSRCSKSGPSRCICCVCSPAAFSSQERPYDYTCKHKKSRYGEVETGIGHPYRSASYQPAAITLQEGIERGDRQQRGEHDADADAGCCWGGILIPYWIEQNDEERGIGKERPDFNGGAPPQDRPEGQREADQPRRTDEEELHERVPLWLQHQNKP